MAEILTLQDALALAEIVRATQRKAKVDWLEPGGRGHLTGTMRAITDKDGNFVRADAEVRDAFVWISATTEWFMPVREAIRLVRGDWMVFD